ncbi:COX15/CtaA family protein [Pontibacter sp. BT310]|uniref:COX15/CtaA family protein n=1 Tax=Pontibacter populi TaxID=890055 RepID=A0ABS6X6Z6_9BACT|nr:MULTISPECIES: COX15/CtaA family protein [Pontibacter]MBJ6116922.1 COX15/CtaA family protein [Pontibacter sp. BT310]MBR0569346.1 COX15/CtaA family protein [Microvirga sp. STS03]MBW3363775.1 COX15/CtaA family protein [Pontibacter populi]
MVNKSSKEQKFRRIGVLTVIAVYFLILVGGIVRSTGSGMGCPDWPKCFGSWVPPTNVNQLPEDYLEVYKQKRIEKNQKLAGYLDKAGFDKVAAYIFTHPSQYTETEFNVTKTWIEYLNRLVGVAIGILIFLTLLYAIPFLKTDPSVFYISLASFILVGFQGWLGSIVVSTNLLPITITIHMALALVLVALLQYVVVRVRERDKKTTLPFSSRLNVMIWAVLITTFGQIMLGTQIREEIDIVAFTMGNALRAEWIDNLGLSFYIHRSFSIVVVGMHLYLAYLIYQLKDQRLTRWTNVMLFIVLAEVTFGVILTYFAMPPVMQPLHLTFAALLFGAEFMILIIYYYASKRVHKKSVAIV